ISINGRDGKAECVDKKSRRWSIVSSVSRTSARTKTFLMSLLRADSFGRCQSDLCQVVSGIRTLQTCSSRTIAGLPPSLAKEAVTSFPPTTWTHAIITLSHRKRETSAMFRSLGANIWDYEIPIRFGGIPLWHRMTLIRLINGGFVVHSPRD